MCECDSLRGACSCTRTSLLLFLDPPCVRSLGLARSRAQLPSATSGKHQSLSSCTVRHQPQASVAE